MTVTVARLDVNDDRALRAWYDAYRAAETEGREFHTAYAFEEVRANLRGHDPGNRLEPLTASLEGEVAGIAICSLPLTHSISSVLVTLGVAPEYRRKGVGSHLLAEVERIARDEGRTRLDCETAYPLAAGPEGNGEPGAEFARRHGFTFGLSNVQRVLDLPVADARIAELSAAVGARHRGYTFRQYVGTLPDDLLAPVGLLRGSVGVEAPAGEMPREVEVFDEQRIRAEERTMAEAGRVRYGTIAVSPDGEVAGYTEYVVPQFDPPWVYQWGTLVWPEHRGHGLGLALKARNTALVQHTHPDRRAVRTWNAEENAPMIAVNEAMGFRPVERLGEFLKRLD